MNKYYVYSHRSNKTSYTFYVGKGTGNRSSSYKSRTKAWLEIAKDGFTVEIIKDKLSYSEAEDIEASFLENPLKEWVLVNIHKGRIPQELLTISDHVYYDETSPTFLRWKFSTVRGKRKTDGIAGSIYKNKYMSIMINRKPYSIHRLVWVLFNKKEIPRGYVVNHIDCNPSNNNIGNLEVIPLEQNSRRRKHHSEKSTGVFISTTCPNGDVKYYSWAGTCTVDGKVKTKTFSILKYGEELAYRLALDYRTNKIKELNEQGAGYTDRHINKE